MLILKTAECDSLYYLNNLKNETINVLDSIVTNDKNIINTREQLLKNEKLRVSLKDQELQEERKKLRKRTIAAVLSGIFNVLFIIKAI